MNFNTIFSTHYLVKPMDYSQRLKTGIFWNVLGFITRFLIGFISSVLFVRLLGPHDYGILTFILSLVFFSGMFVNLGLGNVITKCIATSRASGAEAPLWIMLKKMTAVRLVVIAGLGGIFIYPEALANWLDKPYLAPFLYFIPLIVLTSYFQGTLRTVLMAYYEQKFVNLVSVLEMLIKLGLVMMAIYLGHGIMGFLMALIASQIINGCQLLHRLYHRVSLKNKPSKVIFKLKDHIALAWHSFCVGISTRLLGRESDLLLLGIFHPDITQVAIYAVIYGVPKMIFDVFIHTIGGGLGLTTFTELVKSGKLDELKESYYKILHVFSALLFPAIIGGILVGGELVELFYGSAYANLGLPLSILFIALGASVITPVTTDILFGLGRDRDLMYFQISFGLFNVIINIIVIPIYGAIGVAVTTALASAGLTLLEMIAVHKRIQANYPVVHVFRYLIIALIMGAIIHFLHFEFYWEIGIGVLIYLILFLLQDRWFGHCLNFKSIKQFKLAS